MNSLKLLLNSSKAVAATNWLLLLLFLWLFTQFVWSFWPQATPIQTTSRPATNSAPQFNLNQVLSANLFGSPEKAADEPEQISAPVTRLNLKLRGVYSSEDDFASAMIEHSRNQEVYRIGSKLPGASGLTLYRILPDRIIMSRNGKYETLYVEDFEGSKGSSSRQPTVINQSQQANIRNPADQEENEVMQASTNRQVIDKRSDQRITQEISKLRGNLTDPSALTKLVRVSAVNQNGDFKGFRLSPGQNRALFGRLGLRRNDIVTAINGIALNDPESQFTILEQMGTADEITLSLLRGNRELTVMFDATP